VTQLVTATKPHNLPQLLDELLSAIPGLRPTNGGAIVQIEDNGDVIRVRFPDPVDPAQVNSVIAAHVPAPPPTPPDYGTDTTPLNQIADAVSQLRQYLQLATPTNAQTITAFKITIRLALLLARRSVG
jgi:hypothetical protein